MPGKPAAVVFHSEEPRSPIEALQPSVLLFLLCVCSCLRDHPASRPCDRTRERHVTFSLVFFARRHYNYPPQSW